jgi:DNA mismatch endonuclease (patch repair protein)
VRSPPTTPVRSAIMRSVRSRDTGPEMVLRRALWASGMRYRVHARIARTRPDLSFPGARVAVFVDGCFWHGCPRHYGLPKSNVGFWTAKLAGNVERDTRDRLRLETAGWVVLRVWQCEIKEDIQAVVRRINEAVLQARVLSAPSGSRSPKSSTGNKL